MSNYHHLLSKSRYVSGLQCEKKFWIEKNQKELVPPVSAADEARFAAGNTIGELAQQRFLGGKDATPDEFYDWGPSYEKTKQWIEEGETIIYEASFFHEGCMAALDIFLKVGEEIHAVEVKSSTSVKGYHLTDCSYQYHIMKSAGFTPDRFFLMHINNQCVRNGEINLEELFTLSDITDEVLELQDGIEDRIENLKEVIQQEERPEVQIGEHCDKPFSCPLKSYCWKDEPQPDILRIPYLKNKWALYYSGKKRFEDIEEEMLSPSARPLWRGVVHGEKIVRPEKIASFLDTLEYPLYFFDFETIGPTVPMYDGTRPYQAIPVQYSLHVVLGKDVDPYHYSFLASFREEGLPHEELLEHMLEDLGTSGTILAYNQSFEIGRIKELAQLYPEHKEALGKLLARFKDLIIPFKRKDWYLPEMMGSASIKAVFPAVCPEEEGYSELDIAEGGTASLDLLALANRAVPEHEVEELREKLLAYCEMDTWAMVRIWEEMKLKVESYA
ncbi:MAG: DUF2779 domain-containing protein [Oceanospirillaceae bacterium]|nr:DUF2779 domain-containing protein [Oceanospirillaceae bacterium]